MATLGDEFASLGEEIYEGDVAASFMPTVPSGPIYPRVPTAVPLPPPVATSRNEIVGLRTRAYDEYVDVMHKTLQGFSRLTNCRRTKEVNDGVAKIKELINKINMYDERLKPVSGGKRKYKMRTKCSKRHRNQSRTRKTRK